MSQPGGFLLLGVLWPFGVSERQGRHRKSEVCRWSAGVVCGRAGGPNSHADDLGCSGSVAFTPTGTREAFTRAGHPLGGRVGNTVPPTSAFWD